MTYSHELALAKMYKVIYIVIVRHIPGLNAGARYVTSVTLNMNLHKEILKAWNVYRK